MNRNNIQKSLFKILAVFVFIAPLIALAQTPVLPQVVLLDRIQTHESISMKFNILALSSENQLISLEAHYGLEPERLDKTTPPFWTGIPTTSGTIANLEIKNLSSSTTYYYKIFKKDDAGSIEIPNSDNSFQTTSKNGQILTGTNTTVTSTCVKGQYCLLAPLPGIASYDVKKGNVGEYLNTLFKIGIGIAGVLAVVMLVLGAIQYMSSDSISEKGAGRERMTNAIIGLILALGSIVLLRTLNNNLTIIKLNIKEAQIGVDEMQFDKTEAQTKNTPGYTINGRGFSAPSPSAGVTDFANKLKSGYKLDSIDVSVTSKQATFNAKKSGSPDEFVNVPINIGQNGYAAIGQGKEGDQKTPLGETKISGDRRISTSTDKAVTSTSGAYNLGAAFINIGTNPDRGIGFHGKYDNTLGVTNGCIRMHNDDLIVLAPFMTAGIKVKIH